MSGLLTPQIEDAKTIWDPPTKAALRRRVVELEDFLLTVQLGNTEPDALEREATRLLGEES